VARGLIAWVGLGRAVDADLPTARDPLKDEVHLTDGRVVTGAFEGLSLGGVAIADQSFDREAVAWIRFAGPEPAAPRESPSPVTGVSRPSPTPLPSAPPTPRPPSPGPSPLPSTPPGPSPTPRPPNGTTVQRCGAAAPLGGHITQTQRQRDASTDCSGTAELWFDLVPQAIDTWPLALAGQFEARTIVYRLDIPGCVPTPTWSERCSAPAAQASGTRGSAGNLDRLGLYFEPKDPTLTFQTLPDEIASGVSTPITCSGRGSSYVAGRWVLPIGGAIFPGAIADVGTHPVAGTACHAARDPALQRDCYVHPERYAVIPFRGEQSWHVQHPAQETFVEGQTRWEVCCGCGRPSGPPPPPPEPRPSPRASPRPPGSSPDPCGSLAQSKSLVDTLWAQRQSHKPALERAMRELQSAHDEMMFNLPAWKTANPLCAIGDIVQTVLTEAAGDFGEALDLVAQIAEGDLSYLIESDEISAALEVFAAGREAGGAASASNMRDRIAGCSVLSDPLRAGANAFVDNYERVLRLMPQVQEQVNWFRTQDQKYWDQWNTYYQECVRYARCKGLPQPPCPAPPATPSGPMPPH
jgi:hypothetical protein